MAPVEPDTLGDAAALADTKPDALTRTDGLGAADGLMQLSSELSPVSADPVPAGQGMGAKEPRGQYEKAGHSVGGTVCAAQ